MRPLFQVIADAQDITPLLQDRLLSLQVIDRVALAADSCEIKLDDRDSKIAFPRKGACLTLSLGWQGSGLTVMGHYTIVLSLIVRTCRRHDLSPLIKI